MTEMTSSSGTRAAETVLMIQRLVDESVRLHRQGKTRSGKPMPSSMHAVKHVEVKISPEILGLVLGERISLPRSTVDGTPVHYPEVPPPERRDGHLWVLTMCVYIDSNMVERRSRGTGAVCTREYLGVDERPPMS